MNDTVRVHITFDARGNAHMRAARLFDDPENVYDYPAKVFERQKAEAQGDVNSRPCPTCDGTGGDHQIGCQP